MWKYLRSLNEAGTTIVLTTHYLEEVEQLCRTVAILKKGEKVRDSSVADLLASVPSQTYRMTFDRDPSTIQINELTLLVRDSETADVELLNGQTVTDVVKRLDEHGVSVLDVRPTANRIEHVFLEITNQNL
jgi:ABC-2 type transport system ATP-binding protein